MARFLSIGPSAEGTPPNGIPATAAALQAKVFAGTAQTLRTRNKKCANVIGARVPEDRHDTRTIAVTCSDGGRYMIVVDEATITP
ncbi:hypothetical protein [Burkholderia ubonensis]|uniref:hypothetical protein n=1 Tax=Burkholderia ubonensis TaxID=101571 RepID=UPI0011783978|nr:hypothetical protein [Burkholderia ubonensis]